MRGLLGYPAAATHMKLFKLSLCAIAMLLIAAAHAGAAVNSTTSATSIARAISNNPSQVIGGEFVGQQTTANPGPAAVGSGGIAGFPTAGGDFGVLSTGNAQNATAGAQSFFSSTVNGVGPPVLERGTKAFDYVVLKIDVQIPVGANCASTDMRFMSEEYPGFINSGYNDSFLIEVDRTTWTASAAGLSAPDDVAASSGQRITVDTLGVSGFTAPAAEGTTYNGGSPLLTAKFRVTPGRHQIYISVLDQGDPNYDSAAFVDNLRFSNELPGTCSFQGQGDNTPASLITCGPLGTLLTPCEGLLPKPPKLTICGPEYGTILNSCKGLGLGLGPAPFIGGDVWDDLLVKCPNLGDTCSTDIDAYLEPRGNASPGSGLAVRTGKKSRRTLASMTAALSTMSKKSFEMARVFDDLTAETGTKKKRNVPRTSSALIGPGYLSSQMGAQLLDALGFVGLSNEIIPLVSSSMGALTLDNLKDMYKKAFAGTSLTPFPTSFELQPAGGFTKQRSDWLQKSIAEYQKTQGQIGGTLAQLKAINNGAAPETLFSDVQGTLSNLNAMFTKALGAANEWDGAGTSGKWGKNSLNFADQIPALVADLGRQLNGVGTASGQLAGLASLFPASGNPTFGTSLQKLSDQLHENSAQAGLIMSETNAISQVITHTPNEGEKGSFGQLDMGTMLSGRATGWFMEFPEMTNTLTAGSSLTPTTATEGDLESTNDLIAFGFGYGSNSANLFDQLGFPTNSIMRMIDDATDSKGPIKDPLLQNIDPGNNVVISKGSKKQLALGSTTGLIDAGKTAKLKIKINRQARRALKKMARIKKGRVLTVTLVVTTRNAGGKTVTKTYKVKVGNGKKNRRR